MGRQYLREFEITGRRLVVKKGAPKPGVEDVRKNGKPQPVARIDQDPEIMKMRIFAPNYVVAKSRFFYNMKTMKGIKTTHCEILGCTEIKGTTPGKIKNFEVSLKIYNRRVGFINTRKEYRDVSRAKAVSASYIDVASRNRGKFFDINVIGVKAVGAGAVRNNNMQQFVAEGVKFPLTHVVAKVPNVTFSTVRPRTY